MQTLWLSAIYFRVAENAVTWLTGKGITRVAQPNRAARGARRAGG